MRLTLRTLLAYRDHVLKPTELEDMHGRVQQSAMASNLIKRLESLSQRTNILAPPIEGKGLGGDANSIAEYLDDTLKGDRVPELERICLESDVQLAELAQCHSLLSAAFSTAVDVPATLRQRVVALGDASNRAAALARRKHVGRSIETAHPQSESGKRLREDQPHDDATHGESLASTASTSPAHVESHNGKAAKSKDALVQAQAVTAPMMASGGDSIRPTGLDLEGSHLAHEVPEYLRGRSRDGWLGPVAIGALVCLLCLLVWQSIGSWDSVVDMFAQAPSTAQPNSPDPKPEETSNEPSKANANANSEPVAANEANNKTKVSSKPPASDEDKAALESLTPSISIAGDVSIPTVPSNAASDANNANGNTKDSAIVSAPPVAQWLPADAKAMQSVVLVQAGAVPVHRLQPSESIPSGCQMFVPSANRPKLELVDGPQWQVCGTTHALLIKPENGPTSEPQIDLRIGRAVVSDRAGGHSIALATPAGQVRLNVDNGSTAAIELSYKPKAQGSVIDRAVYSPTLSIFGLEGSTEVQLNNERLQVAAGNRISIVAGQATTPEATEPPLWIDSTFDRPVDLQAATDLAKELNSDTAIGQALQRLATHRRPEMRALAAQTLSLLGNWDWVTQAKSSFSEVRDRSFWAALLDRTRQILAAHPENVDALAASLQQLEPSTAQWRLMLWLGLDAAQLQNESGKQIMASLESDALIERVLASQQLLRATGKDLGYQAGEPSRTIVIQWSRDFSTGKIPLLPIPKS